MSSSTIVVLALCFVTVMAGRQLSEESDEKFLVAADGVELHGSEYKEEDNEEMIQTKALIHEYKEDYNEEQTEDSESTSLDDTHEDLTTPESPLGYDQEMTQTKAHTREYKEDYNEELTQTKALTPESERTEALESTSSDDALEDPKSPESLLNYSGEITQTKAHTREYNEDYNDELNRARVLTPESEQTETLESTSSDDTPEGAKSLESLLQYSEERIQMKPSTHEHGEEYDKEMAHKKAIMPETAQKEASEKRSSFNENSLTKALEPDPDSEDSPSDTSSSEDNSTSGESGESESKPAKKHGHHGPHKHGPHGGTSSVGDSSGDCPNGRKKDEKGDCFSGCPEHSTGPSFDGNCECKKGYLCYDSNVMEMAQRLEKELKSSNGEKVKEIVEADQDDHPGCAMNADGENHNDAKNAATAVSRVKFSHKCPQCKCKSEKKSNARTFRLDVLLAIFAFALATF